ncbi:hypothetical protein RI129_002678 [Pyrocoelia pectoralis]|uniref:RRM domain-containing protein n=1 Tax=Pyrocoelia pectoralis TaxID=417401 RepID=A0AAN7VM57_9COLE
MNPLTNTKNITKLSEQELKNFNVKSSWHDQYRDSAWVFIGGLPYDLTEGDIIAVFSQYGEIVNINLVRDKETGKSKGFCFLCYEDQRSTILSVDNLNGIKIVGRTIRVDHVSSYKVPKDGKKTDAETKRLHEEGCAPKAQPPIQREEVRVPKEPPPQDLRETLVDQIASDIKLPMRLPIYTVKDEPCSTIGEDPPEEIEVKVEVNKEKKEKEKKVKKDKKKKHKRRRSSSSDPEEKNEKKKFDDRYKR